MQLKGPSWYMSNYTTLYEHDGEVRFMFGGGFLYKRGGVEIFLTASCYGNRD